ncbi:hypothetical protein TTHERM_00058540 (macronuclear) [Tetrahymena thermophila SB210]|uniref:Kinase domain protein n=1 Tax=Tetrahymena thermophila (strain SB210) TaxID=312017 RepID=I7MDC8_TETTS|nr:hypothetical protein TTHERM_00058540 [Tetrahymena thermophila SB210]EAR87342.1 hypothetical protein TTHERM_00058540 [Tetrahymena thermophila SB210]|eukprot:XP_001007587.1 hypothetical protein TTHERM_00058540 [Tetrahymena thermophila SB210]
MRNIKNLSINIKSCEINDEVIINLSKYISSIQNLEDLDLQITENCVLSENALEQFFLGLSQQKNIEKLKMHIISLSSLNLQNKFIETLKLDFQYLYGQEDRYDNIGISLQNMKNLIYLDLNISQQVTSICLDGIGESLTNLKNIKTLKLSLLTNYTYVDSFQKGINSLCNLENLKLQIRKRDLQKKIQQEQSQLQKEVVCIKNLSKLTIFELKLNSMTKFIFFLQTETEDEYIEDLFREIKHLVNLNQLVLNVMPSSFSFDASKILSDSLNKLKYLQKITLGIITQEKITLETVKNIRDGLKKHKNLSILNAYLTEDLQQEQENYQLKMIRQRFPIGTNLVKFAQCANFLLQLLEEKQNVENASNSQFLYEKQFPIGTNLVKFAQCANFLLQLLEEKQNVENASNSQFLYEKQ